MLVAGLWAAAPAAAVETYYASPSSTRVTSPCPQDDPCTLNHAASAAVTGDTVIALAGTYNVSSTVEVEQGATLRGAAGPRPVIRTEASR